jgi:dihydroneopterin aldolase
MRGGMRQDVRWLLHPPQRTPLMTTEIRPQSAPFRPPPDRIIVNGLVVDTFIGVHDFERHARQRVRFDVDVDTVAGYADIVRTTGTYVSYADIVEFIQARAATDDHVVMVETWAEDIAAFVLDNELADAVRVSVQKIDIFAAADGVGITIERHSAATATR